MAALLDASVFLNSGGDNRAGFGGRGFDNIALIDPGDLGDDIYPVEQGSGYFVVVAADTGLAALTPAGRITGKSAETGVAAGNKHETGQKGNDAGGPRDGDAAVFKGLPEDFQDAAR